MSKELLQLSGTKRTRGGYREYGNLFCALQKIHKSPIVEPWHRSGSETYLTTFTLSGDGPNFIQLVLKACTPTSIAIPIDKLLNRWVGRRRDLAVDVGASFVPRLFGFGNGVLLEEYISLSLHEVVSDRAVLRKALETFVMVRRLGYDVNLLFGDMRSRGQDVVLVDFGEDLGEAQPIAPPFCRGLDSAS